MRPSYDAEHPHSTTPIYDELYSEYRRLFRALPGDRSGEENLKFAGFAVREGYPVLAEPRPYPPQQQSFQSYGGQLLGAPQFMPNQSGGSGPADPTSDGTGHHPAAGHLGTGHLHTTGHTATGHTATGQPSGGHTAGHSTTGQFVSGQGWVAAGYLGPVQQQGGVPAPPAPAVAVRTGGRHRNLLSLPPGRSGDHH
ncbi:hypothetical protein ACWGB8_13475 [Kitasatospora sp. NPDC054939]